MLPQHREQLVKDIAAAINPRYGAENLSNTPDYILAEYLCGCMDAWNAAVQMRETWYGRDARPFAIPGTFSKVSELHRSLDTP